MNRPSTTLSEGFCSQSARCRYPRQQNPISRLGEPGCTEEVVSVKIEFLVGTRGNEVHRRWHSHRHLHHCQHRTLEEHCGEPQEHTEWFNIKAFGKRAEVVAEHLHKGSRIFLEGRPRTQSWDDKQSGSKKYMTFVYADKVEFLGESQRDGKKGELTLDQSYSQEDPTMTTDSDVPF